MFPSKPKLYIGCSLTYATDEFKQSIIDLKQSLKDDFEILEFLGLIDGTSKQVFDHDTKCVLGSDFFVAICDYPSLGLGVELGIAFQAGKKTLVLSRESSKVSRMVLGMESQNVKFDHYQNNDDLPQIIRCYFQQISEPQS
ncbi:MAG: hypothetical protein WCK98_06630 [bacterium]